MPPKDPFYDGVGTILGLMFLLYLVFEPRTIPKDCPDASSPAYYMHGGITRRIECKQPWTR